ncbi:MAG: sigma-70 family RNA polymerase sigma factor [Verrucomicrobiota bacterium]
MDAPKVLEETRAAGRTDPEQWLELYGDYLFGYAIKRVGNQQVAEDLVQETFLAALKAHDRFAGQSAERSWLVGILKHKLIDHYRKNSRYQLADRDAEDSHEFDHFFDDHGHWNPQFDAVPKHWQTDPGETLERKEFQDVLRDCVDKLPARMGRVFLLCEMEEADSKEVCATMGVSPNNLWVLLYRARMNLRVCLERNWFHSK